MKHNLDISIDNGTIIIYDKDNDKKLWSLPTAQLGETRQFENSTVSNWIHHLDEKKWITIEILYRLASIIHQHHPESEIDWKLTFFPIEKGHYLDTLYQLKKEFEGKPQNTTFKTVIDKMKLGKEENSEELNNKISSIVEDSLKDNDLPL